MFFLPQKGIRNILNNYMHVYTNIYMHVYTNIYIYIYTNIYIRPVGFLMPVKGRLLLTKSFQCYLEKG